MFNDKDRKRGGKNVAKKYGSAHMVKIGKAGRAKQLKAKKAAERAAKKLLK